MTSDAVSLSSSARFQHLASVADVGVRCGLLHQCARLNGAKGIFLSDDGHKSFGIEDA